MSLINFLELLDINQYCHYICLCFLISILVLILYVLPLSSQLPDECFY